MPASSGFRVLPKQYYSHIHPQHPEDHSVYPSVPGPSIQNQAREAKYRFCFSQRSVSGYNNAALYSWFL